MCVEGGYKTVTSIQIANCLAALKRDAISYRAVRVFFACLSVVAIREAAKRTAKKRGKTPRDAARFRLDELCSLTGLTKKAVKKELRCLLKSSLVQWSESSISVNCEMLPGSESLLQALAGKRSAKRPIPVPRTVVRYVAKCPKSALGKTVLAHIVRGLSIDRKTGEIRSAGTVKASWIAGTFELSLRSVKAARKSLIESGFVTKDTGSFQRKLNRDGAYFQVNLAWREGQGEVPKVAPLMVKRAPDFAPPYKDKKTSYESKNQKTENCAFKMPGVCKANERGEPNLKNVKPEDLKAFPRLKLLFGQATKAGWLKGSEADFLNWVSAAIRANSVVARDPVRVFVSIVKQRKWELVTQAQEERARRAIRHYREKEAIGPKVLHASGFGFTQSSK